MNNTFGWKYSNVFLQKKIFFGAFIDVEINKSNGISMVNIVSMQVNLNFTLDKQYNSK